MNKIFAILSLSCLLLGCNAKNEKKHQLLMYIGTSTNHPKKGIEYCYFDTMTGAFSQPQIAAKIKNPNFLSVDAKRNTLYAVGTLGLNDSNHYEPAVVRYAINPTSGELTKTDAHSAYGKGPCYVSCDEAGKMVFVANYSSGNVACYQVENGMLTLGNTYQHQGNGPNTQRQNKAHAHSIDVDAKTGYLYAADLGADKVMIYKQNLGKLQVIDSIVCHPGAGPRHFAISPNNKMMAVLNELDCSVSIFKRNSEGVFKNKLQTITMLPDTVTGFAKAADIHFSPDGKFLYASNRGFNSIAIYRVSERKLTLVGWETNGINWARNFAIDPSGKFLLVANRKGNNITLYQRDLDSGLLTLLPNSLSVESPMCIRFFH